MQCEESLENSLSEVDLWKKLLRKDIYLYPDGFYKLSGIFGHSATFGFLKIDKYAVQAIRSKDGSIKEPWLSRLAHFMKNRRSRENDLIICDNHILVVLGLLKIASEVPNEKEPIPS